MEDLNYRETVFSEAVGRWWTAKGANTKSTRSSQGAGRDSNLKGDTMNGFRDTLRDRLIEVGVSKDDIFYGGQLSKIPANLPSYFRASKNWDILVVKNSLHKKDSSDMFSQKGESKLIAAIEFKSQKDSIGKNQNNRIEESIGNAVDFWSSYENLNFGCLQPRPWLGYLFIGLYDDDEIGQPVNVRQPHFCADEAFQSVENQRGPSDFPGPSYAERYRIFFERMIAKKMYDSACFITTNERLLGEHENYRCYFPRLSGEKFIDYLLRHVRAYYFDAQ
ncbi:PaeR7I family type II restriction endonuclease [Burkholderia ubonensis]|uniref:PaeR7I family type II restriction endonuclease n=1 Tax=Burkholderia ubonensis TaxID=101571 RepID=UPI0009B424E3|nr:PaeR7I family type II restriction endonuclease [Burkholderia ubonensis]